MDLSYLSFFSLICLSPFDKLLGSNHFLKITQFGKEEISYAVWYPTGTQNSRCSSGGYWVTFLLEVTQKKYMQKTRKSAPSQTRAAEMYFMAKPQSGRPFPATHLEANNFSQKPWRNGMLQKRSHPTLSILHNTLKKKINSFCKAVSPSAPEFLASVYFALPLFPE